LRDGRMTFGDAKTNRQSQETRKDDVLPVVPGEI
jgi:hypothetical protein